MTNADRLVLVAFALLALIAIATVPAPPSDQDIVIDEPDTAAITPAALRVKPSPIICVPQRHQRPGALDKEGWNPA